MKWFDYSQNNTFGTWKGPALTVVVEAESAEDADRRACEVGVYFDGCDNGDDCACCGDRWHRSYGDGTPTPEVYGQAPADYRSNWADPADGCTVLVVHADGRREEFRNPQESLSESLARMKSAMAKERMS